jgi:hypothetical protein
VLIYLASVRAVVVCGKVEELHEILRCLWRRGGLLTERVGLGFPRDIQESSDNFGATPYRSLLTVVSRPPLDPSQKWEGSETTYYNTEKGTFFNARASWFIGGALRWYERQELGSRVDLSVG